MKATILQVFTQSSPDVFQGAMEIILAMNACETKDHISRAVMPWDTANLVSSATL